ncbi:polyprenyl synthetase family protein [Aquicoccus sp. G2-2]|uniref:polyprenyl synthetase family protein n=1 Tax=Aquicoccus sp. G2-2 TaxID=3092120 RepID=UPI002AE0A899|nr:farnesyl diphosphate synthase [Aquicoccus sp. G2-2]MEA1114550.1 farnesyl diphosphate synthase [Aquicoccus sp. G2-2]
MFEKRLDEVQTLIAAHLREVMAGLGEAPVAEAMRYASGGGKRLRACLVIESARLHDIDDAQALWAASAVECLHAYSLVHDDLPCMDDDDIRRGLPTVHRQWDEATAVLAGDALQALCFEVLARSECSTDAGVRADLVLSMAEAAGVRGMVLGQALDIAAESAEAPLTLAEITQLQAGKTGALITWSACAGARLAQADVAPLTAYGDALGLAFQIADDVLDVEGHAEEMGKAVGKDEEAGKATFVSLLGLDEAKHRAAELVETACEALSSYGDKAESLREAARFVISRRT